MTAGDALRPVLGGIRGSSLRRQRIEFGENVEVYVVLAADLLEVAASLSGSLRRLGGEAWSKEAARVLEIAHQVDGAIPLAADPKANGDIAVARDHGVDVQYLDSGRKNRS